MLTSKVRVQSSAGDFSETFPLDCALSIPDIREIWKQSIEPALQAKRNGVVNELRNDEEEIRIELMEHENGRRILRTRASENSLDWRHFNFWREGESNQRNGPCKAFPGLKYHPVERTDSECSMEHLKDWIKICDENHTCRSHGDPVLPSRVIRVSDDRVRVIDGEGRRGRYMTLSHRWGDKETFTLKKRNMAATMGSIPWKSIPKVYQESIQVTRLLGIEYIWIDTLCIVQDDAEDWKREAGKMKAVYGSSYLNIAATEAVDSYGDLFASSTLGTKYPSQEIPADRDVQVRAQPHQTHRHFGSNYYNISPAAPPAARLGPAGAHPVAARRCGGMAVISNFKLDYYGSLQRNGTPLPYEWMRIGESYSCLDFTYDGDRLVALAGLAEQGVQSGKGGRYLAGLWERSLPHQLCWEIVSVHRKPAAYIAPSWSWLSVFGMITYANRMDFNSACFSIDVRIAEASCTSTEGAVPTTSTSPIVGSLRLKGRGVRMRAEVGDYGTPSRPPVYRLRAEGEEGGIWVRTDYAMGREDANAIKEVFLLFLGCMWPDKNAFLILRSVSSDSLKFERIGLTWLAKGKKERDFERILERCKVEDNIVIV
ncbi:hypothetical protein EKO27_g3290 [Xylaria grammica]|uniref:Heterokaryon incompatibility domain-containing protein n=1 Tax=Xylaria grammica TaxID=363999 RepID=A0A439DBN9_9PEZI|nr:hypothetical protein EKO27_g3290 [Xylaria grammica]